MALNPGDKLGPYEIVSRIGAGGIDEVYKARDNRLDRTKYHRLTPKTATAFDPFTSNRKKVGIQLIPLQI